MEFKFKTVSLLTIVSQLNSNSNNENHSHTGKSLQQLDKLPNNQILSSPCSCQSSEVAAAYSDTIHWADWRCVGCGKHRGWIEHPETTNRREVQNQIIDRLLGVATEWERRFLEDLRKRRKRSPKQLETLAAISEKYSSEIGGAE